MILKKKIGEMKRINEMRGDLCPYEPHSHVKVICLGGKVSMSEY